MVAAAPLKPQAGSTRKKNVRMPIVYPATAALPKELCERRLAAVAGQALSSIPVLKSAAGVAPSIPSGPERSAAIRESLPAAPVALPRELLYRYLPGWWDSITFIAAIGVFWYRPPR